MVSLKNRSKGFTIVELLIVIVVIAILATLVIVTFTGIQQKARNSQRQTDINALDSHLEAYFAENGYYPDLTTLTSNVTVGGNSVTWISQNMKGLDPEALKDPKGGALAGTATDSAYGYATTGCGTGTTAGQCTGFTLTAKLEGASDYTKSSNS